MIAGAVDQIEGIAGADLVLGRPFPLPALALPLARWTAVAALGGGVEIEWNLDDTRPGTPGRVALYAGAVPPPQRDLPPARRRLVLARELLIALGVLFVFLLAGNRVLDVLHLRQESVSIAGGIILFLIGIRMIFPSPEGIFGDAPEGEPFIVPLAIPCIAGPSTMAALLLLGHSEPDRIPQWSIALVAAWLAFTAGLVAFVGAVIAGRPVSRRPKRRAAEASDQA